MFYLDLLLYLRFRIRFRFCFRYDTLVEYIYMVLNIYPEPTAFSEIQHNNTYSRGRTNPPHQDAG